MVQTLFREEVRIGPEYEAVLMVCSEEEGGVTFRARVWIGSVFESEPLLYLSRECDSLAAAERACRQLLRAGLKRLGGAPDIGG